MKIAFNINMVKCLVLNRIYEVQPTDTGWNKKNELKFLDIDYNKQEIDIIGHYISPTFTVTYDLTEGRYYLIENDRNEERYYQFKNGKLYPINYLDFNDKQKDIQKENDRLRAEIDSIYKKLKTKKGEK